jgi:threonine aldolase
MLVDLRSDTATRPTAEMRAAMAAAEVGSYVLGDDPEAALLEAEAAAYLGQEQALFLPTATMANQVAMLVHLRRGDRFVVAQGSHVLVAEGDGFAEIAHAIPFVVEAIRGVMDADALSHALRGQGPTARLVWVENTHTRGGGSITDLSHMNRYAELSDSAGASIHVDGARLPNAAACLGLAPADLVRQAGSVTLSLNKALGAPVGAILAGDRGFIDEAARLRIRLGGAWRKPGNIAAAARVALRTPLASLHRDHELATKLAAAFRELPGCSSEEPQTNIVLVRCSDATYAGRLQEHLAGHGILVNLLADRVTIRCVTHYSITDQHAEHCTRVIPAAAQEQMEVL